MDIEEEGIMSAIDINFSSNNSNLTMADTPGLLVPKPIEALMYIMYISISVAAIGGNGIVCFVVLCYRNMRTVTNYFIVNLAIGDIMMACLCIPFGFVSNLLLQYWPFGSTMCVLVSYSQAVSVFISAYTLIAISIDRYIAIIHPLRVRMTKTQAKGIILLVWLVALVTPLPTAIMSNLLHPESFPEDKYQCVESWDTIEERYYYSMVLMTLQYFFPLTVLIFTYTRIAITVWGKRTPGEAEDARDQRLAASKRKVCKWSQTDPSYALARVPLTILCYILPKRLTMIKMMITCVTAFTLCWLPFNSLLVIGDQHPEIYQAPFIIYVWFAFHWLAMSHACCNPFIYCWMNSKFRSGFAYVFRFIPCVNGQRFLQTQSRVTLSAGSRRSGNNKS